MMIRRRRKVFRLEMVNSFKETPCKGIKKSDHQQTSFEKEFAGGRSNGRNSCGPGTSGDR
jgi:hypothetical protein